MNVTPQLPRAAVPAPNSADYDRPEVGPHVIERPDGELVDSRTGEPVSRKNESAPTPEEKLLAAIEAMRPGRKALYQLIWWCRGASYCSTAVRVREMLCSLYNSSVKCDLANIQNFDVRMRGLVCEVLMHMGRGDSGLWDHHIREACKHCGMEKWFDEGFKRRRSRS